MLLLLSACGNGSADSDNAANSETAESAPAAIDARFEAMPTGGFAIGDPNAPVSIVEYGSYTCSHCAEFEDEVYPELKKKYIDTGKVRFEFRTFVRNGPDLLASMVVDCSGQDKFAALSKLFFSKQRDWLTSQNPNNYTMEIAKRAGISQERFQQCVTDQAARDKIIQIQQNGIENYQVNATPTIIINGEVDMEAVRWEALDQAVSDALKK